jgi:pimeloyl-ACP methyl ester carboxylesterase
MVLDLAALLDATMGKAPVCLVGNSFGALLAVAFARRFPERVTGLVLVDGHLGDGDFGARMAGTLSLRGEAADRAIAESFKEWLGRHSDRKRNRLADQARALVEGTTLVSDVRATRPLTQEDLAGIRAPTLALYGERSDIRARSEALLARMPRCSFEVLRGCSHSILWEATDVVRDRILSFCRDLVAEEAA